MSNDCVHLSINAKKLIKTVKTEMLKEAASYSTFSFFLWLLEVDKKGE